MSLTGSLQDVSVADLMQFIYLGGRTGTLALVQGSRRARISFHRGQIVGAAGPDPRPLGDALVAAGLITPQQLHRALSAQLAEGPRRPLGQLLAATGEVSREAIRDFLQQQIQEVVCELVQWREGSFRFAPDEVEPLDDVAFSPGIFSGREVNTQLVLLEALRIFDERRHHESKTPGATLTPAPHPVAAPAGPSEPTGVPGPPRAREVTATSPAGPATRGRDGSGAIPVQVVTGDPLLVTELSTALSGRARRVVRVDLHEAGTRAPNEPAPLVVFDLRAPDAEVGPVAALVRSRPRLFVAAVTDDERVRLRAYEAGAVAVSASEPSLLAASLRCLLRHQTQAAGDVAVARGVRSGFARLRRVFADIRAGVISTTVSLQLMSVVAESVERAVLFVAHEGSIVALGAFGAGRGGRPLAESSRGLRLDLASHPEIGQVLRDGAPRVFSFGETTLARVLGAALEPPQTGQFALFPILGAERVVAIIYADNGRSRRAIEGLELLELAACAVGLAFENELLRRRLAAGHRPAEAGRPAVQLSA